MIAIMSYLWVWIEAILGLTKRVCIYLLWPHQMPVRRRPHRAVLMRGETRPAGPKSMAPTPFDILIPDLSLVRYSNKARVRGKKNGNQNNFKVLTKVICSHFHRNLKTNSKVFTRISYFHRYLGQILKFLVPNKFLI